MRPEPDILVLGGVRAGPQGGGGATPTYYAGPQVGVGMLRGTDPLLDNFRIRDLSRSHPREILFLRGGT